MKEKILITSALPYANGPLHFGHIAGAYLPGDCYARFERLQGKEVLYLCGSDEHGVAITLSAELAGRTPQAHVDHFHALNRALFEKLHFSFDHYSRTTWPGHQLTTQDFYHALARKGLIEERVENHLYSEAEKRFLADRYVVGECPKCGFAEARGDECQRCAASYEAIELKNPRSKVSGSPLTLRPSKHLYLRFDHFREQLKGWLEEREKGGWKPNVVRFARGYVEELKPRAITRDSEWGIPVPGHRGKVFYVWFDAPIGYISAAREWAESRGKPDLWKEYWLDPKTRLVQFIGKDNIPFHAVFFPAMLMGQDLPYKLPDELPANEFFLLEGRQFSKSDGWTIDLDDFFTRYTPDQARYAIAANAPESSDAEFHWKDFQGRCNGELLGKLGNFVNRVLVFVQQHGGGEVPPAGVWGEEEKLFLEKVKELTEEGARCYAQFQVRKASQVLMELAQTGNVYFDLKKPWTLAKDPARKEELQAVLSLCLDCIKRLALVASPIIPETAQKIWELLGESSLLEQGRWSEIASRPLPVGRKLPTPKLLFRKIEDSEIEQELTKLSQGAAKKMTPVLSYEPLKEKIPFDTFEKLDLRVGQIVEASPVPKSKKLLKLLVDLGFEKRTVVSGIALSYPPEKLLGKKVLLVANLEPAKLMGIESQGMILAASLNAELELPEIQHLPPGARVS